MNPKVTVVMPVYNAEKYIEQTINAILNQTFQDFELLLIDDHPTDKTWDVINQFHDSRIRILRNDRNRGIAYSRSRGIKEAMGEYVALMDDDDLTPLDRLEKEVEYLEANPEIGVVGGSIIPINNQGEEVGERAFMHTEPEDIRAQMMFFCPMANSSTLFRKSLVDQFDLGYKDGMLGMEDYRFWVEMSFHAKIVNFQDVFLYWRTSDSNETANVLNNKREERKQMFANILLYAVEGNGIKLTEEEKKLYTNSFQENEATECPNLELLRSLLKKMISQVYEMNAEWAEAFQLACRNHFLGVARSIKRKYFDALGMDGFSVSVGEKDTLPLVSVVIPTHNREKDIIHSIESVLKQTYKNIEVIVVDDCSTDYTYYVAKGYAATLSEDIKVQVIRMDVNGGPAKARNKGASLAQGEFLAFHDDDDLWHPDKLDLQMKAFSKNPEISMSFAQMARFSDGNFVNIVDQNLDWEKYKNRLFQELLMDNYVGAPTILIRKTDFEKTGGFNEEIDSLEDWEFAIRAARDLKVTFLATPCMDVHISDVSVTHNYMNYAKSWSYIYNKFAEHAEDKDAYNYQMLRHLDGAVGENPECNSYILGAMEYLLPENRTEKQILKAYTLGHGRNAVVTLGGSQEELEHVRSYADGLQRQVEQLGGQLSKRIRYVNVSKMMMRTDNYISDRLKQAKIQKVAIYGMGILGKCLVEHLNRGNVQVVFGIDKKPDSLSDVNMITIEEFMSQKQDIDAIIITPLYEAENISKQLTKYEKYRCISIEELC